ncbi:MULTISPECIES: CBS domain-containing protein [Prosthecochloris]|uniref:CBS domain-containing protein n=1 Tax=Prosthecochloris vibrioformis TaxID=1098 RepID=A0A5C4S0V7_PROVB|nr:MULTISPECIES: CBS domain-containing protein [Prosthecochloris]ANT64870.1 hypothetical protein Ptc2401_01096 [Prosthecochloris sp. CIB 2401]TNJ37044.1 CBS domain-containing protein [Prosthecochloris vibrioformis]
MSIVKEYLVTGFPRVQADEPSAHLHERLLIGKHGFFALFDGTRLMSIPLTAELGAALAEPGVDPETPVSELLREHRLPEYLGDDEHMLDVVGRLLKSRGPYLPVLSGEKGFSGVVSRQELLEDIVRIYHLGVQDGVSLELEVPIVGVRVSDIVAAIEKNDATVLSFGVTEPRPGDEGMVITFRLQTAELFRLVKNLENYGYLVRYHSRIDHAPGDELRDKVLEFMKYIEM